MSEQVEATTAKALAAINGAQALVASTDEKLLSHNDSRSSFLLTNDGATDAWVSYGVAAAVEHEGYYLASKGALSEDEWPGEVHVISSGVTNVCFIEKSYATGDDEGEEPTGAQAWTPTPPAGESVPQASGPVVGE